VTSQAGPAIDAFDLEIVEFVWRWAPYGGPPEDECLPRFGMPADRLRARFREILRTGCREHLGDDDRMLVERAAASLPTTPPTTPEEPPEKPEDRPAPPEPIGKPVLRRGVWRWT
jgi:hypothetical protein